MHIHYKSKVFGYSQKLLFLILKVLFLMKEVKHHNVFIYYTKYKSSSVTLTLVKSDIFTKIGLKVFFSFMCLAQLWNQLFLFYLN